MKYGRYQVIREIGRGSMGIVYEAHDPQIDRRVALKVLREDRVSSPDYVKRFWNEPMAVGRLSHRSIVTVYDFGVDHDTVYIAMELLEGVPLKEWMKERPLELGRILEIGSRVAEALHYAHRKGIVHRDIKPANIICSENGDIKVTDFGIAHIEDSESQQMTQAGEILGTPVYMSPEQVLGQPVDGRSDIYSLGVILYELTTGKRPFQGSNIGALFKAITNDPVEPPVTLNPDTPAWFSAVIMKMLAREPGQRYSSGESLVREIERSGRTTPPPVAARAAGKSSYVAAFAVVMLLLAGGAAGAFYLGYLDNIEGIIALFRQQQVTENLEQQQEVSPGSFTSESEKPEESILTSKPEDAPRTAMDKGGEALSTDFSNTIGEQPEIVEQPEAEAADGRQTPGAEPQKPMAGGFAAEPKSDKPAFHTPPDNTAVSSQWPHLPPPATGGTAAREPATSQIEQSQKPAGSKNVPAANDSPQLDTKPGLQADTQQLKQEQQEAEQEQIKIALLPKPVEATKMAQLKLHSRPEGARIYIDENFVGETPFICNLTAEKHEVMLQLQGHNEWRAQLDLSKGGDIPLSIRLLPKE